MSAVAPKPRADRRHLLVAALFSAAVAAIVGRIFYLQTDAEKTHSQAEGKKLFERTIALPAGRGAIYDRDGEPLAVSAPVYTLKVEPAVLLRWLEAEPEVERALARLLEMDAATLRARLERVRGRKEYHLKKNLKPEVAEEIRGIRVWARFGNAAPRQVPLPGITRLEPTARRFYPMVEVAGQLVGFTNYRDEGISGVEKAFDERLRGTPGKAVEKSLYLNGERMLVEAPSLVEAPRRGENITLSIDRRLQYLAYRSLKAALKAHEAEWGAAVLLDSRTGEILAMANWPGFNPNSQAHRADPGRQRNRALSEPFEPGSTVKPFTIAAALEAGVITERTVIDTTPGFVYVGRKKIRDAANYGPIDPATILMKSSNVGTTKIALTMPAERLWKFFYRLGLGLDSELGLPAENPGRLGDYFLWNQQSQALFSYGYGFSINAVQLARAYAVLANDGVMVAPTILKRESAPAGERVMPAEVARKVRSMLETVVSDKGTGRAARVAGYHVAGKTGTTHRYVAGKGYSDDNFTALFAGMAPASDPRLVLVVVVQDPGRDQWHGGAVAAPIFARIMSGALRLLDIAPDDMEGGGLRYVDLGEPAVAGPSLVAQAATGGR